MKNGIPYEIPAETLRALKLELPWGSIQQIANRRGLSRTYVDMVFANQVAINETAYGVITEAQRIIRDKRDKSNRLKAEIKKTLGK